MELTAQNHIIFGKKLFWIRYRFCPEIMMKSSMVSLTVSQRLDKQNNLLYKLGADSVGVIKVMLLIKDY